MASNQNAVVKYDHNQGQAVVPQGSHAQAPRAPINVTESLLRDHYNAKLSRKNNYPSKYNGKILYEHFNNTNLEEGDTITVNKSRWCPAEFTYTIAGSFHQTMKNRDESRAQAMASTEVQIPEENHARQTIAEYETRNQIATKGHMMRRQMDREEGQARGVQQMIPFMETLYEQRNRTNETLQRHAHLTNFFGINTTAVNRAGKKKAFHNRPTVVQTVPDETAPTSNTAPVVEEPASDSDASQRA